jgi:hypothetical protein
MLASPLLQQALARELLRDGADAVGHHVEDATASGRLLRP